MDFGTSTALLVAIARSLWARPRFMSTRASPIAKSATRGCFARGTFLFVPTFGIHSLTSSSSSRCGKCDKSITDRIITALSKKWHPECFTCATCNQPFPGGSFFERDGFPYCSEHFYNNTQQVCGGCSKPVTGECVNAMNRAFHPGTASLFFFLFFLPFSLYWRVFTFLQPAFAAPIVARLLRTGAFTRLTASRTAICITILRRALSAVDAKRPSPDALSMRWERTGERLGSGGFLFPIFLISHFFSFRHPEHFTCAFCVNPLGGGNYTEKQGKPYCNECFENLFS